MSVGLSHRRPLNTHLEKDGYEWLLFALQHNERANPEGIAFVRSLRGVHTIWRDTCDDVMTNPHWMAPSVNGGFAFVEDEMPGLVHGAIQSILDRRPLQNYTARPGPALEDFPVFQQNVARIVQAMHTYSSDMPTQARIMHELVKLFSTRAIVPHVRRIMQDLPHSMPLVRAVLKNMKLYRREYAVAMLCVELLRLLCRNTLVSRRIAIDCGAVIVLLAIMNTDDINFDDQPASYAPLRIACYDVLKGLCAGEPETSRHVSEHGGLPIVRQVLMRDMDFTGPTVSAMCRHFR